MTFTNCFSVGEVPGGKSGGGESEYAGRFGRGGNPGAGVIQSGEGCFSAGVHRSRSAASVAASSAREEGSRYRSGTVDFFLRKFRQIR